MFLKNLCQKDDIGDSMKYGVKDCNHGVIVESTKTNNYETARSTAIALSNWNIPCDVVDLEKNDKDGNPRVLKHLTPYKDLKINISMRPNKGGCHEH